MKDESGGAGRLSSDQAPPVALPIAGALWAAGCDGAQVDCVERAARLGVLFKFNDIGLLRRKGRDHRATDIAEQELFRGPCL